MTSSIEEGYRRIYYLDLALHTSIKQIITLDKGRHYCFFKSNYYKHCLHSNNDHLNSISDLLVSLNNSLESQQKEFYKLLDSITNSLVKINQILE